MTQNEGGLDKQTLEEALRDALKSVLGNTGAGINPRVEFYDKFQREMEEHDRDFERKYDEDLNTTLIFSGLFSAVTSAFIIDLQSELQPDYEEMNNTLLEMLLNATTGTLPAGSTASIPRWSGPDPIVVQVQCIFYATICATLLASFLAMLGKQWLNRYRQNETRGSTAERSRVRERKLTGIETWKFHIVMESLPIILQCALILLGFGLSRYLWEISRSVSSVIIGFTTFGFLFYLFIVMASIFSFDCPFQTPFSLVVRFAISLALPYWRNLQQTFRPPKPGTPRIRPDPPPPNDGVGGGHDLEAGMTIPDVVPAAIPSPLFPEETDPEADKLDARCINRMIVASTGTDVVVSTMDFIPEVIWHSGIKEVPLKRIYDILNDCFDSSGPQPVVIPKMRHVAYLSARAFTHIGLQRRCINQYEEDKKDGWKAICTSHPPLSSTDCGPDSDLKAALFMVDMTLGHNNEFPWKQAQMTPTHRAWMSHVFLYRAWDERQALSEVVMDFVENSMSLRPLSDVVITDCLLIIGLMIGVPFRISDITVRDKSREKEFVLGKVFETLSAIFSSKLIPPLAIRALRLVTRLSAKGVADASYKLFKAIMASDDLTDQYWEAARLAIHGAFQRSVNNEIPWVGDPKEIIEFLDHHLGLQAAGEDHRSSIAAALNATSTTHDGRPTALIVKRIETFNCASPSFVKGMRSILDSSNSILIRKLAVSLVSLVSDQWFNSEDPVMESEDMSEFCEHLAVYMVDDARPQSVNRRRCFPILFGMLRSPEWRNHIVTRLWGLLAHWTLIDEEQESFKWCLEHAIELLEFTKGLLDLEGSKWWYGTLWFHFDKLDPTVRVEVERIAKDISSGDGLSDLNLYLDLIGQEVKRARQELDELTEEHRLADSGMKLRARIVTLEGNHRRLAQITSGQ